MSQETRTPDTISVALAKVGAREADAADFAGAFLLLETSRPGVFAVGDVRHGWIKRVATAVGEGAMAVRLVHERLALPR